MSRLAYCVFAAFVVTFANATTIKVSTQQDFEALSQTIVRTISKGEKTISVNIEAKELTFADNQISLKDIKRPDVSIAIHGNGVRMTSAGHYVKVLQHPTSMYMKDGGYYNPWTPFLQLADTISIVNQQSHICRITTPVKNRKDQHPQNRFINYTCWYTSRTSPVTCIGKDWLEFDGGDWAVPRSGNFYNMNMDYAYAKQFPRYRLFGTEKVSGKVYECEASTLLCLTNCNLRCFTVDHICVTGSSQNGALIMIDGSQADSIVVSNSIFRCIGGTVLTDRLSTNVCFTGNKVDTFIGYGVQSGVGSKGAKVTNNTFSNCTLGMKNGFAIQMCSDDFVVSGNTVSDFSYGGIGVGIWGGTTTNSKCRGIVTGNELFYTEAFLSDLTQHTLMDSGAIYTWTRTDGVTISNNYIHDIAGIKDNRGIFCDDGTKNVTITQNRIERIHNSYDIDLRWSDTYKEQIPDHNIGNKMLGNSTTGKVRFETQKKQRK